MKTTLACILASAAGLLGACGGGATSSANIAPIGPDFVSAAPRLHIDRDLVASPAMNRINPLDVVPFQHDSAVLSDAAITQVDTAAQWLRRHGDHRIVLEGHADRSGPDLYNEDLATRRIAAIRDRLLASGIASDRIILITYGEAEALDSLLDNDRRVVLFATKQQPQQVIAQQLEARDVVVATWTDRESLMQLRPGSPPVKHEVVGRR